MQNNDLKDLIKKRDEAEKALKSAQGKIAELTARGDELSKKLTTFDGSKREARISKIKAVEAYAVDVNEATRAEFDKTKQKLKDLEEAEVDLVELRDAAQKMKQNITESISKLNNALTVSERDIWAAIYEAIKLDIQTAVGGLWFKAYASKLETGSASYQELYADIFGQMPPSNEIQDLKGQVAKEYGLDYFDHK